MAVCRIMVCVCLIKLEVGIWSPGEAEISLKCAHAVCVAKLSTEPNNNRHWSVDVLFKSCSLSIDCRTNPHTQRPQAHELLKPLTTKSLYPASRSLYPPSLHAQTSHLSLSVGGGGAGKAAAAVEQAPSVPVWAVLASASRWNTG